VGAAANEPGLFIAVEGPEGAGKSSQVRRLTERLRDTHDDVLVTREPGGTPAGDRIREVLLDPALRLDPLAEVLLYAAARSQHVLEVIAPALAEGRVVLSDRFAAATVAYQGFGRGLDLAFVEALNQRATLGHLPDLIVLLDVAPETGLRRIAQRGAIDRLERADLAFHRRVRAGFLAQAQADPSRWHVIDAEADEQHVAAALWDAVGAALERWRARSRP
jgi:dTMP kinase